ncbi:MAG TPA: DUF1707 domain-containing protein [Nocardioidaceae bacterium]|nr:DUF1707 domain-containing protein [Nocardioidaceae bacterium]
MQKRQQPTVASIDSASSSRTKRHPAALPPTNLSLMTASDQDDRARRTDTRPPNKFSADLGEVGSAVGGAWAAANAMRSAADQARAARAVATRSATLASDADRELVSSRLEDAYAHGRLTQQEFNDRTDRALTARTHGELDAVLHGLGGLRVEPQEARSHPARKVVFWVSAFFTGPFLFLASMLLLFGDGLEERVWGVVLLVIFLPGVLALHRWAWPKLRDLSQLT